jgi:glyoxylase-like metal-dependent hydrolase (beta-lactamase superfamily II)
MIRSVSRVVLLASLVSAGAFASAQRGPAADPFVKEGATVKVAAHTHVIPDFNVGLVPNVGIIVGSRATLVIDPGLGRRNGEAVLREVAKVSKNTELYIVTTHFHAEHTTGYIAFPATAKYVNSKVQEAEFAEGGMSMVQMFSGRSAAVADILKDAARRPADITFDSSYDLHLGGVDVRLLVVGPTHTKGDTVAFVTGDNVLFAGDVVMNNSFLAASAASSMKAWLAAFTALDAMKPVVIVPSHGAIGSGALIAANRELMRAIQARAGALKAQGKTIDEAATTVQSEMVAQHPDWPRANGVAAAARSAYQEAP